MSILPSPVMMMLKSMMFRCPSCLMSFDLAFSWVSVRDGVEGVDEEPPPPPPPPDGVAGGVMGGVIISGSGVGLGSFRYMTERYGSIVMLPVCLTPSISTTGQGRETVLEDWVAL
ncbi:MAG: hypothetical protein UR57_C0007G0001 [Candidatus Nomurabacteria bacterium GW2011_GWE2_34_25]|nr:MAG: hypothetical protein UR57_C0007G0001 [Candidatus Nomurabacteria bacterium GW2011_GWE2_34_25]